MKAVSVLRRAARAYCRANVAAWAVLRGWVEVRVVDPWVAAGAAQFAAVVALVGSGHPGAAMTVAALGVWLVVLQRLTGRNH